MRCLSKLQVLEIATSCVNKPVTSSWRGNCRSCQASFAHHNTKNKLQVKAQARDPFSKPDPETKTRNAAAAATIPNHKWSWRGHQINYMSAGCGEPIVLVHGFGASSGQYRQLIPILAQKHKVYALDLLGFGGSDKPPLEYCMELWRDQIKDFVGEFLEARPVVLVGNSIGSLAVLMASVELSPALVRGTVLLNTAGAMNNKGIINDWRIVLALPIILLIDVLLRIRPIAEFLFSKLSNKEVIRGALLGIYANKDAVDDELVEIFYKPSTDPGALDVFVSVITGPPGPKVQDLVPRLQAPLLVLWGDQDTFTPVDGPIGEYAKLLPQTRPGTTFKLLPGTGHCLMDDRPELVGAELLPWLEQHMAPACEVSSA